MGPGRHISAPVDPEIAGGAPGWHRTVVPAMGTTVTVLVPAAWASMASVVADLFAEWEARLSRFRPSSELARLNRARRRRASPLLFNAVETAVAAAIATDGLFDPTLLDRLEALGYDETFEVVRARSTASAGEGTSPTTAVESPTRLDRAAEPAGGAWRAIRLDRRSRTIELPPGVRLDLGGIAKGMAVDAAVALLAAVGVPAAAVEAGGDLAVHGPSPDGDGWRVEIEHPGRPAAADGPDEAIVIEIASGAVATSSTARRRWRAGDRWLHHLIDPRTGEPAASGVWSTTVAAPSCTEAEVAAKVALLLGVEAGLRFLGDRGYAGLFIDETGRVAAVGIDGAAPQPVPVPVSVPDTEVAPPGASGLPPTPTTLRPATGTP